MRQRDAVLRKAGCFGKPENGGVKIDICYLL